MAPPTTPTEIKRRRGTLRADRVPNADAMVAIDRAPVEIPPPPSLREAGIAMWTQSLKVCSWIATSDLPALCILSELMDRRAALMRSYNAALDLEELLDREDEAAEPATKVKEDGVMFKTSTGYSYGNPILKILHTVEEDIAKWMSQLGMTPSSRAALGVAEVKVGSELDRLAAKRAAREAGRPGSSPPSPQRPQGSETARTSSTSSTPTDGSQRTASPARRALRSTRANGSDSLSGRPSPATL